MLSVCGSDYVLSVYGRVRLCAECVWKREGIPLILVEDN